VRVLDVEVSRPPGPSGGPAGPGGLHALIRWHGIPVAIVSGAMEGDGHQLRRTVATRHWAALTRRRLRALLQSSGIPDHLRLADLQHVAPPADTGPVPLVTVAVCTRDRTAELAVCLDALLEVEYPTLDLLVIDNAPSAEDTARLLASRYPGVRYVCEPRPGLDWARNRAIREARGEILAFTDDDAVVDRAWLTALVRVFTADPEAMAVTGLVVPFELQTTAQQRFERYGGFGRGCEREWYSVARHPDRADILHIGAGLYGTGANMAYRREVFERIGEFDPALDVGTVTHGGGDLDMFFRVVHHGLLLVYEPAAIVRHRHRRTEAELRQQLTGWGSGFYAYLARNLARTPRARGAILRFGVWYFWRRYLRRLVAGPGARGAVPRRLVLAELRGALSGVSRYRRARAAAERIATGRPATTARGRADRA
jgi:GT2 family glycosyltransferase